jgi:hypothetical protein
VCYQSTARHCEVCRRIESERPEKCEAPYVLRIVQIVRLLVMRRQGIVQRGKRGNFVVDRNAVVSHRDGCRSSAVAKINHGNMAYRLHFLTRIKKGKCRDSGGDDACLHRLSPDPDLGWSGVLRH